MSGINLLNDFQLRRNNYHIIFHYYVGGYENYSRTIDYMGSEVLFPDGTFTEKEKKKIYDYLYENYGNPPFKRRMVKQLLENNKFIDLT